jgi:hypothetical protein
MNKLSSDLYEKDVPDDPRQATVSSEEMNVLCFGFG